MNKLVTKIRLIFLSIKKISNWWIYFLEILHLLKRERATLKFRDGFKYAIRTGTTDRGIVNTAVIKDEYQLGELDLKGGTVIDIGGQNGYFSVFASKWADKIFTFEPTPENYKLLLENIAINNLESTITPANMAVSGKEEIKKIYLSSTNTGGHSIYGSGDNTVDIPSVSLLKIFEDHNLQKCDLLKIDAEGAEYDILYNLPDNYFNKIKRIRLEVHQINNEDKNLAALMQYLKDKGYDMTYSFPLLFAERQ